MSTIHKNKKLIYLTVFSLVVLVGIAATVPVYKNLTLFQQIKAGFKPAATPPKTNNYNPEEDGSLIKEVWNEVEKLQQSNNDEIVTMSGKISLYDNVNQNGVKEVQRFSIIQSGKNQIFSLDSFDRIQLGSKMILVDHQEKEVLFQNSLKLDSIYAIYRAMDPKKIKEMLAKDGTRAKIEYEDKYKVLRITPGTMDMANRYKVYYDTIDYQIKKLSIAYTSTPFIQNDQLAKEQNETIETNNTSLEGENDTREEWLKNANITEYIIEYNIENKEKKCDFDFWGNNNMYEIDGADKLILKGKLKNYKIIKTVSK